jgi:hypothetical protein
MSATTHRLAPPDLAAVGLIRRAAKAGVTRRIRILSDVGQGEVGRSSGVPPQTVLRWEQGQRSPRTRAAERYTATIIALLASLPETDDAEIERLRRALGLRGGP